MYDTSDFIFSIDHNEVFSSSGDFIMGFKVSYPEKYSQREDDFEDIKEQWFKVARNLPIGTIILKSDVYLKKEYDSSIMPQDDYLQKAFVQHFKGREYIEHSGYVFFVHTTRDTFGKQCCNPFNIPTSIDVDKDNLEIDNFRQAVLQACLIFSSNHSLSPLSEKDILDYHRMYFNGFQTDYLTNLEFSKAHLETNNKIAGIFTINNESCLPDYTTSSEKDTLFSSADNVYPAGFMDDFGVMLKCSHILNQIIHVDDNMLHLNTMEKAKNNLARGAKMDHSNKTGSEAMETYLNDATDPLKSIFFIRGNVNLIFWEDSLPKFNNTKNIISAKFKQKGFTPSYPTSGRLRDVFFNSFFTNISGLSSENLYLTQLNVAISLFVNNTTYKDDPTGIYFIDRLYNIPIKYDMWDEKHKRKKARNQAVIAEPGSGKSFFNMFLFWQMLDQNVKHIIMDMGNSYGRFVNLYPKEETAIITFQKGTSIGLNPFRLSNNNSADNVDSLESLEQFIWIIIKRGSTPSSEESTSLRMLLSTFYAYSDDPHTHNFEGFYNFIKSNVDNIYTLAGIESTDFFELDSFLHNGSEFVGDGTYAYLLKETITDTESTLTSVLMRKRLVMFELDDIQDSPLILNIAIMAIKETIRRIVWTDRTSKAIVHFDEFAKQLKFKDIQLAVEYYMQTARKYNGCVSIVLQDITQLPWDANATLNLIGTFVFLEGTKIKSVKERLDLSSHTLIQMESLHSNFSSDNEYKYSEILIVNSGSTSMPYRIETPYEAYLVFQTEGDLYEIINTLYARFEDIPSAVEKYISAERANPQIRQQISVLYSQTHLQNPNYTIADAVNQLIA